MLSIARMGSLKTTTSLVCLHGGPGMDYTYFLPYLQPLADDVELVFYRQHQHDETTIDGLVNELHAAISLLDDRKIVLLGHSFGSTLALEYTKRHGTNRLSGLILMSWLYDNNFMQKSSSRNAALFETIAAQEATIENTLPSSSDELYRQKTILWTPAYFHQSAQAEGQFILETLRYNHKAFQSLCDSYLNNFDLNLIVREIKIPCLSIAGTDDRVVDIEYVRNGANMNKDITQVELKASGHFPFVEKTTEVNESILNFIKEKIR